MRDEGGVFYAGLKQHGSRALSAVVGETERHMFLVGTCSVREDNEIHLLEFDEDINALNCKTVLNHPEEIYEISPCPADPNLFFTVHRAADDKDPMAKRATLWSIPKNDEAIAEEGINESILRMDHLQGRKLKKVFSLDSSSRVRSVIWDPMCTSDHLIALTDKHVEFWLFNDATAENPEFSGVKPDPKCSEELSDLTAGCWDPHQAKKFVTINGTTIRAWDLHNMKTVQMIENAHERRITGVDFNPNKPYHIATCSEDRTVKFWDLRNSKRPLKILGDHSHWLREVRYNRFHDQLVISGGSDGEVQLWSVVSISSAPLGELEENAAMLESDSKIRRFTDHEESVYSLTWSSCDAWVFASLSYDGRVVVNRVPAAEKYKILL